MTDNAITTAAPAIPEAASFDLAQRQAKALASSALVPDAFRGNVANCLIALELAQRIGAAPFAVMQNLDVIHGRPSFRATFLIACVNGTGRFSPLRYETCGEPGSKDWGCRAVATDRDGNRCEGPWVTWGMAEAEGWTKKNGSKWRTMPELMFRYRAAAFFARVFAPELTMGIHTSDEREDMAIQVHATDTTPRGTAAGLAALLADGEPVPETPRSVAPMREPGEDG